jgi:heme exporter protein D
MESFAQFLAMGGYAAFVWPAYAIAAVVMIGVLAQSLRALRAREAELAALGETSEPRAKR